MSIHRVPEGVPAGGQFTAATRGEAAGVALAPAPAAVPVPEPAESTPTPAQRQVRALLWGHVQRLIARPGDDGAIRPAERQEDVEHDVRADFPYLDEDQFTSRMSTIGRIAEQISVVESADAYDTDSYRQIAENRGIEPDQFPSLDPEPGDSDIDYEAYHAEVIATLEGDLETHMHRLIDDEQAAREQAYAETRPAASQ